MTFGDAIKKAVETNDARLAGDIVMRAREMGANYNDVYAAVKRVTGIELAAWDDLLLEADALDAEGPKEKRL